MSHTKIKTFEDACKALNLQPTLPDVSALPEDQQKAIIAHYKLVIIAQALNAGWKPDWSNGSEYKYYPWFWYNKAASGFSCHDCDYDHSSTYVGSRLCFKSSELAEYAGTQFIELYNDYYLIA